MAGGDEDDDLLDDGWDDLPLETFDALEKRAIESATSAAQHRTWASHQPQLPPQQTHQTFSPLPAEAIPGFKPDNHFFQPIRPEMDQPQVRIFGTMGRTQADLPQRAAQTSAAGAMPGQILHGAALGQVTAAERGHGHGISPQLSQHVAPPARQSAAAPTSFSRPGPRIVEQPHPGSSQNFHHETEQAPAGNGTPAISVDPSALEALQVQVKQLDRRRGELETRLVAAQSEIMAKTGEVAFVRDKRAQLEKEMDRKILAQEKRHEDEMAKMREELEKTILERDNLKSATKFEKQDARDEAFKSKYQHQRAKAKNIGGGGGSGGATAEVVAANLAGMASPSKAKGPAYRDGFDDDEIMIMSPSKKSGGRSGMGTPRMGSKRKRKGLDDSPIPALQLSHRPKAPPAAENAPRNTVPASQHEVLLRRFGAADSRYEMMLNHRISREAPRTFEALTRYSFPSKPQSSLATVLLDEMVLLSAGEPEEGFIVAVCQIILAQWSRVRSWSVGLSARRHQD